MIVPVHQYAAVFLFCFLAAMAIVGIACFLCLYLGLIILA